MKISLFRHIQCSLLGIAAAVLIFTACKSKNRITESEYTAQQEVWTCSMHPEILRDKPGTCPICGMDLIKKEQTAPRLTGIKLDELIESANKFVVSSIPLTTISKENFQIKIDALGSITYDTRQINTISTRVSGRIERLFVKYRYQHIMKGEPLIDIYSPELLTAEQDMLFLIKDDPGNTSLINSAKQKLLLLGLDETQIQNIIKSGKPSLTISVFSNYSGHIHEAGNSMPTSNIQSEKMDESFVTEELPIKEGMYVEKGQVLFQVFNTDRSWALLNIYPEKQALIKLGDQVSIIPETAPAKAFHAKVDFIEPFFRQGSKTLAIRVYFDNSSLQIPIGSQVRATILSNATAFNWLPQNAVLSLGSEKVVFIKAPGGFKAHKVETGISYESTIQILAGLNQTDSVAANAQYLIDSESFIKINNQP